MFVPFAYCVVCVTQCGLRCLRCLGLWPFRHKYSGCPLLKIRYHPSIFYAASRHQPVALGGFCHLFHSFLDDALRIGSTCLWFILRPSRLDFRDAVINLQHEVKIFVSILTSLPKLSSTPSGGFHDLLNTSRESLTPRSCARSPQEKFYSCNSLLRHNDKGVNALVFIFSQKLCGGIFLMFLRILLSLVSNFEPLLYYISYFRILNLSQSRNKKKSRKGIMKNNHLFQSHRTIKICHGTATYSKIAALICTLDFHHSE